ncbi:MAG: hypothetical protein V4503_02390 [Gemmatimonadota bacterium]
MTRRARWVTAITAAALSLGATALGSVPARDALDPGIWKMIPPAAVTISGRLADPRLAEASGAAVSSTDQGLIWTIDDSGNPPDLLATDTTGALRADFSIQGATNVDWEEVAVGPCGASRCVYIADTGDNLERRADVVIYRLPEPAVPSGPGVVRRSLDRVEALRFRYPDRAHDVEAMAVTPDGAVLLVTKGRSGGILLFRLGSESWASGRLAVATRRDSLPIVPSGGMGREVTGMALSADAQRVVIRTYRDLYLFGLSKDDRLTPLGPQVRRRLHFSQSR